MRDRRFVVGDDDALALAEWADTPTGGLELHDRPAGTLHVTVDDAVLAGATGPVPRTIARALGLRPGCRRTFPTRYGPVAVADDGQAATRGSLRPVALAVGAAIGDELIIALYADGRESTVTVVPADRPAPAVSRAPEEHRS